MMTKKSYFDDKIFVSKQFLLLIMLKFLKVPVFFVQNSSFFLPKLSNSRFFHVFPGEVEFLCIV